MILQLIEKETKNIILEKEYETSKQGRIEMNSMTPGDKYEFNIIGGNTEMSIIKFIRRCQQKFRSESGSHADDFVGFFKVELDCINSMLESEKKLAIKVVELLYSDQEETKVEKTKEDKPGYEPKDSDYFDEDYGVHHKSNHTGMW